MTKVTEAALRRALRKNDNNAAVAAEVLGLCPPTVLSAMRKFGIERNPPGRRAKISKAEIQNLVNAGVNRTDVAARLGCSASYVSRIARLGGRSGR